MLAVYFSYVVTRRAVDASFEHVIYEGAVAALMLAIAFRSKSETIALPRPPQSLLDTIPLRSGASAIGVIMAVSMTVVATEIARVSGAVAAKLGVSSTAAPRDPGDGSCGTYNDSACSGDSAIIDVIDVFTASVSEELAYRYALLIVIARVAGVRIAVVVQAVVFGLSHTGFERGYSADLVIGLIAVGVVSAVSVLVTRSIWPAIAAHALHSMGVATFDHDLPALSWMVSGVYLTSAVVSAFTVSRLAVGYVFRCR